MIFAPRPMVRAAVAWLVMVSAMTVGLRLMAQPSQATVPFTAPGGYTVDLPADWRLLPPSGQRRMATAATGPFQGQLSLEGGDSVALQVAEAKKRPEFQSVPHPGGTMYFTKKVAPPLPTAYQIFVDLGGRAVHVNCSEAPGNETGPAGCLTIARSLRLTASSGNAAPAPSTPQAPVQTVATPATTVPTADARGDDGTVPLTVSDTGFTVDVPASWERREGGRGAAAFSPDRTGRLTIEGGVSLVRSVLREAERTNQLKTVPSARGRVLYSSRGEGPTQVGYQIFAELGDQAARFECWERKGDTGPGGCFAIARSGRFAPSTAPAVPQTAATAPLTSQDGFTVDVPAEWTRGELTGRVIAGGRPGRGPGGGVSIGPAEQEKDESIRYVLATAEKGKERYRCLPLRDGRVCFTALHVAGGTFYVSIGQRVRTFQCSQEGLEWTGPAACEAIAQTARFEAPASSASPPATLSGTAPLTSRYGLTLDVPSDWKRTGEVAQSADASGQVSINMATMNRAQADEAVRWALRNALQSMQHPNGVIYYERNVASATAVGYSVVLDFKRWAGRFTCRERVGTEDGSAGCLAIARSARFAVPGAAPDATAAAGGSQPAASVAPPVTPSSSATAGNVSARLAAREGQSSSVPFNSYRGMLLTVRDIPTAMSDRAALLDATRAQVSAEQSAWQQIDAMLRADAEPPISASQAKSRPRLNPKKPAFTYEWQAAVDSDPGLAARLMTMFLRSDADWSIVTGDPAWDDRFPALVDVFMFARDRVVGREAGFAAQELTSVYRRHLEAAAAQAPAELWIGKALPAAGYDFDSKALRFLAPGMAPFGGRHTFTDQIDILDSAEQPNSYYTIPASAKGRANYQLFGVAGAMQKADPAMSRPGRNTARSPLDAWRTFYQIGSSWEGAPMVELLTLDRRVELSSIPIDARKAELLAQATGSLGTIGGLTAKVYFDADHVELSERTISRKSSKVAVLFATVQKIDIHDDTGDLITTIAAEALRQGAPPTEARPEPAPAPPKPATPAPGQADRARERQQQQSQRTNDRMAEIKRRNEISLAVQREAQTRMQACVQQAAKAHPNQATPAYQQAVAACSQKVQRMAMCVRQTDTSGLSPTSPQYQQAVDTCVGDVWR